MKSIAMNTRDFLKTLALGIVAAPASAAADDAPAFKVTETRTISLDDEHYHGWPTVARRGNGQLVIVCSGGREEHICPFGRVDMFVSDDDGKSWSWPRTILDGDLDDRDAGVLETSCGTLLVTTFTSLAYDERILDKPEKTKSWPAGKLARWKAARDRIGPEARKAKLGEWIIRSTDGGSTWSPPVATIVNSPHGPVQLSDGRLLYAGKQLWTSEKRVGVCESRDDGLTWKWIADIPARPGDKVSDYHELHAVECKSGRIVAQIRNHNKANSMETLQTESGDGGRTWSEPHAIGVWGLPSHLLRLRNGCLLMSYGHRRAPLGNQVRISTDEGRTWSGAMIISGDGTSGDLGYPSTVELADGTLLTIWYETMKGSPRAVLRQARWMIEAFQ